MRRNKREETPSPSSLVRSSFFTLRYFAHALDCSQPPNFSMGLSRLVSFDRAVAILVCTGECNLGRVSNSTNPRSTPLGSPDTLPRSRSPLQTKMSTAPSKHTSLHNPTEKWGDCEQSTSVLTTVPSLSPNTYCTNNPRFKNDYFYCSGS